MEKPTRRSNALVATALTDDVLDEVIVFLKTANPFSQHTWGWDTGRFIDFRWGGNVLRNAAEPGFFGRHCALVRRGVDLVALIVAEIGADDHCILTPSVDRETLDWAMRWLLRRRRGQRLVLYPSDEAVWVHEVLLRHGLARRDVAGLEWGYDLGDIPDPVEPAGFAIDSIRIPDDYAGIDRCLEGAFGGNKDRLPVLEALAANPMFRPELSVVARAGNADIAAYCRGTVDPETGVGGIDPVATRPDYQRRGLGKAVVLRCFAEQARLGGTATFIGSGPEGSAGSRLYRSLNPQTITSFSEWSRPQ